MLRVGLAWLYLVANIDGEGEEEEEEEAPPRPVHPGHGDDLVCLLTGVLVGSPASLHS